MPPATFRDGAFGRYGDHPTHRWTTHGSTAENRTTFSTAQCFGCFDQGGEAARLGGRGCSKS